MNGMRQKTLGEPSPQNLATEGRGEAPAAGAKTAEPLVAKPAPESPALTERLMEKVCNRENLGSAFEATRAVLASMG